VGKPILVGISNYNDDGHLEILLQSIDWYTYRSRDEFDLVVCDDGSRPEMLEKTRELCARYGVVLLENGENQGIPATWNHLTLALGADSEIVILLNNDLLMPPNWLKVMVHFLTANKDNRQLGSAYWNPYNQFGKEMMRAILPRLGHVIYKSLDAMTGKDAWFDRAIDCSPTVVETIQGKGQGLGRVMCPCGCCFGFRRDAYDLVQQFNQTKYGIPMGFDERIKSFHEECLEKSRRVVYKTSDGDIHVDTVEELFTRYVDTLIIKGDKEYVFPPDGTYALSGEVSTDEEVLAQHLLTDKQRSSLCATHPLDGPGQSALRVTAEKMSDPTAHVNVGVWDRLQCVARKKTNKALVHSRNKFGATTTTTDHSLIVYDQGALVECKPRDLAGRSLERVFEFPATAEIDRVDLVAYVSDAYGKVEFDDDFMWLGSNPDVRFLRTIECETPEMDALCSVLGAYVSEGHIQRKPRWGNGACTFIHNADLGWVERVAQAVRLLFSGPVHVRAVKANDEKYKTIYNATTGYGIANAVMLGLCGRLSENVRLPNFVFRLSDEHKRHILDELLHGDGFRPKKKDYYFRSERAIAEYFLFASTSRGLIADLSVLLCQLGIRYTIGTRDHKHVNQRRSYWIRSAVKFYGPRGNETTVSEEVPAESGEYVYDLSTETTHRFVDAEGLILVHNSMFGTILAVLGRASWGLPYPRPYHAHGYTFGHNPELEAGTRMHLSRRLYRRLWEVPDSVPGDKYFDYINEKLMPLIPETTLKFLTPDYDQPPDTFTNVGGEIVFLPKLIETEGTYRDVRSR